MTRRMILAMALVTALPAAAARAAQVQDLVRLKGAETSTLVGMGLVVGLAGTGDGGKFLPAMRPLAAVCNKLLDPAAAPLDLKDGKSVAVVTLMANLPDSGVREGDHVDVKVACVGPAKSLAGGQLLLVPMLHPVDHQRVMAFAHGAVTLEDPKSPTAGVVKAGKDQGAQLTRDVFVQCLDKEGRLNLVINPSNASWPMANNLASLINGVMAPDGPAIAKAVDPRNVVVQVPTYEQADPAAFISQVLQAYVDPSQIAGPAKVVINERLKNITLTGDVEISPVVISHKGLKITTIAPEPKPTPQNPKVTTGQFVALDPAKRGGARLADLLNAFNQLNVEAEDRIAIIRQMHKAGKLHGQLIEE